MTDAFCTAAIHVYVGGRQSNSGGFLKMSTRTLLLAAACAIAMPLPALAQAELPQPTGDPLAISRADDPILSLSERAETPAAFRAAVAAAVANHPLVEEAEANLAVADAEKREARAGLFPDVSLSFQGRESIVREFAGDQVENIVERTRARGRADALFSVEQTILDFGATSARIEAGGHRLRSAALEIDATAERIALSAVAAWYDVFAYRALVSLAESFLASQDEFVSGIEERIESGVSAPGDLARAESSIAITSASLARYRRQLASAEARYTEMIGRPPPPGILRAPDPELPAMSREMAEYLARTSSPVEAAREVANAAYDRSRAAKAERLPQVAAGVDGGYYGLFDPIPGDDYDVRARVSVRQTFFTGTFARADAESARANAAFARAEAIEEEAAREAAVAYADVAALDAQLAALADNYVASRTTRDVLAERFRAARGTLFDVLQAEDAYFAVAGSYIQTLTERDAARYVLLARTGRLLEALRIDASEAAQRR